MEPFTSLVIFLVICGIVYYLLQQLPIAEPFMTIIRVVIIIGLILWLLQLGGVWMY